MAGGEHNALLSPAARPDPPPASRDLAAPAALPACPNRGVALASPGPSHPPPGWATCSAPAAGPPQEPACQPAPACQAAPACPPAPHHTLLPLLPLAARLDHLFCVYVSRAGRRRRLDVILAAPQHQPFAELAWTGGRCAGLAGARGRRRGRLRSKVVGLCWSCCRGAALHAAERRRRPSLPSLPRSPARHPAGSAMITALSRMQPSTTAHLTTHSLVHSQAAR